MDPELTDEEKRFMQWLEEDDVTGHQAGEVPPQWHELRQDTERLRNLLRSTIPASQEPPGADTFNDEIRRRQ